MSDSSWLEGNPTYQQSVRHFDYGVGDDLVQARQHERVEIAARIRRAAAAEVTLELRQAYEQAARLAEGAAVELAQGWPPRSGRQPLVQGRERSEHQPLRRAGFG